MTRKILRRCSLCGKFHAAYLVPEHEGGKGYYCYACWKATYPTRSSRHEPPDERTLQPDEQSDQYADAEVED